jgi:type II secretory pathway component PulK
MLRNRKMTPVESRRGSVLILTLWAVVLLSVIIGSFAFDMHIEARIASYYRKRLKADYLARSGIERARMLLVRSADPEIKQEAYEEQDAPWYANAKRLAYGSAIHGVRDTLDTGSASVSIVPEPARRNVNRLQEDDWERILELGGIPEDLWPNLIDGFLDWTDADGNSRPYGAETDDYYGIQEMPSRAKNGPLYTVDELLLIKAFTPQILYGGRPSGWDDEDEAMTGIADLLTVFGDGKVNVNAASARVLMSLPSVDDLTAEDIINEREGNMDEYDPNQDYSFENESDFFGRIPVLSGHLKNRITVGAGVYRITSIGTSGGVSRRISCIATVDKNGRMTILRWQEDEG